MKRLISILLVLMCLTAGIASAESADMPPNIFLPGWRGTTIEADRLEVHVDFWNPAQNENWYDLTFELWAALPQEAILEGTETQTVTHIDEETGETTEIVYAKLSHSDRIKPGERLENAVLFQPVPVGDYDAFVHMQAYYVSDGTPTANSGNMRIELHAVETE